MYHDMKRSHPLNCIIKTSPWKSVHDEMKKWKEHTASWVLSTPVILALGKLPGKDHRFKASLGTKKILSQCELQCERPIIPPNPETEKRGEKKTQNNPQLLLI